MVTQIANNNLMGGNKLMMYGKRLIKTSHGRG